MKEVGGPEIHSQKCRGKSIHRGINKQGASHHYNFSYEYYTMAVRNEVRILLKELAYK
jgi:hypothetical protein